MHYQSIQRRGLLLVLSSPSGAGKTTLGRLLKESDDGLEISISITTRKPRSIEKNGTDYIFVSEKQFKQMEKAGDFLESAHVFGNNYGTQKSSVEKLQASGKDVLFDVDWQGRQKLADAKGDDVVSVFILPPNADELKKRLTARAQEDEVARVNRMKHAPSEISHYAEYDYIIVNADLAQSLAQLKAILIAERFKRSRQTGLRQFVDGLLGALTK